MPEGSVRNQMEQTISVWSDRHFWDHLGKWSTLTGPNSRTKMFLPFDKTVLSSTAPLYLAYKKIGRTLVNPPFLGKEQETYWSCCRVHAQQSQVDNFVTI